MTRRNISLPADLDERARHAGLNVSALAQQAVADELDRRERMARLDAWLDALDELHGVPSEVVMTAARAWIASLSPPDGATAVAAPPAVRRARRRVTA